MTARNVSFAFLCEGSSDTGLIAHLETLLVYFGVQEATGMPDTRKGTIPARLRQLRAEGTEAGIDMVFIHRDSDDPDRKGREREIRRGVEESGFPHPFIPVIPVQETEAWLLLDEPGDPGRRGLSKRETTPEAAETECHRRHQKSQGNPAESTSRGK